MPVASPGLSPRYDGAESPPPHQMSPPSGRSRVCPTRVDGRPALFAHKLTVSRCHQRQRESYHKCATCVHNGVQVVAFQPRVPAPLPPEVPDVSVAPLPELPLPELPLAEELVAVREALEDALAEEEPAPALPAEVAEGDALAEEAPESAPDSDTGEVQPSQSRTAVS